MSATTTTPSTGKSQFTREGVGFGNAEDDVDEGELVLADRDEALAIAREFLEGDFEALRQRSLA